MMKKSKPTPQHKKYWSERFALLEQYEHNKSIKVYETVREEFEKESRRLQREIEEWYQRIADNENITLSDAKKLLDKRELEEFKWDVKDYIKAGRENARVQNKRLMQQLENASARVHITRLEAKQLEIDARVQDLFKNYYNAVDDLSDELINSTYNHTAFEIQKGVQVAWPVQALNEKQVNLIKVKPWAPDGVDFSSRIWNNREKLVNELHTEMTRMFIRGGDPTQSIKNIAKIFNVSKSQAGNLVMTESAYFYSAAQQQAYKELEIDRYHIVATLDARTSQICQDMDGEVFKLSEYEPGATAPPFHNYCRSATSPYFDDGLMPRRRWARNLETGKGEIISGDIKYRDWKQSYVDKYGRRWWDVHEKMVKNESADRKMLKRYREILGKEMPRSLSSFQDLKYNDYEKWNEIQDHYYVKSRLKDGRWTSIINPEKQAPHMESTGTPGRSYFYDWVNVQDIFDRYAGTGIVGRNYDGRRNNTETVILDRAIGVAVSRKRVVETDVIRIHYSAKRTHISPVFPKS